MKAGFRVFTADERVAPFLIIPQTRTPLRRKRATAIFLGAKPVVMAYKVSIHTRPHGYSNSAVALIQPLPRATHRLSVLAAQCAV